MPTGICRRAGTSERYALRYELGPPGGEIEACHTFFTSESTLASSVL